MIIGSTVSELTLAERMLVRLISIALIVFCFNLFIPRNELLYLYDSKRVFVITVVIAFSLLLIVSVRIRMQLMDLFSTLSPKVKILLAAMFLFSMLATSLSDYTLSAWTGWLYFLGLISTVSLFYYYFFRQKKRFFNLAAILSFLLFCSVAFAFWIRLYNHLPVGQWSFIGFSNPRFINQIHIWFIIPLGYLVIRNSYRNKRYLSRYFNLILAVSVCITLNGRGVTLALIAAFILIALLDVKKRRQWLNVFFISILIGTGISLLLFNPVPSYILGIDSGFGGLRTQTGDRLSLWSNALEVSRTFGLGAGAFVCNGFDFGRPHNSVLNVLVHWGMLPAICFVLLCLLLLIGVMKTPSRISMVLGVNVLAGLMYSLVSGVLDSPLSQLLAVMSLAAYWSSLPRTNVKHRYHRFFHLFVLIMAFGIIIACGYRLYDRWEHYPQKAGESIDVIGDGLRTQFWLGYNCLEHPIQP